MRDINIQLEVWFWQLIISPHMADLAKSLAAKGCKVVYAAHQEMSPARKSQGWAAPQLGEATLAWIPDREAIIALVKSASPKAIHICQGIRGNGIISVAQDILAEHRLPQWIVMETVDDSGFLGVIKRFVYWRLFHRRSRQFEGVLAIGERTMDWVVARGVPHHKVVSFAYFLPENEAQSTRAVAVEHSPFRILFVGQFIERKRLDLLIEAMAMIDDLNIELAVVGSGPLEQSLRHQAESLLPGRVVWIGQLSMSEVRQQMAQADCLVLPSRHDGWGAVVSEALMVGTQVICSDRCGAASIVRASGVGGVFASGNQIDLRCHLVRQIAAGRVSAELRASLGHWALRLGATQGADYLIQLLLRKRRGAAAPLPPWI